MTNDVLKYKCPYDNTRDNFLTTFIHRCDVLLISRKRSMKKFNKKSLSAAFNNHDINNNDPLGIVQKLVVYTQPRI